MSDNALPALDKAITTGLSDATTERTIALYDALRHSANDRPLLFRGDLAENYQYDKIIPTLKPAQTFNHIIIIEGISQKTGQTGCYQVLANQWKLLEVLARLD